MAIEPASVLPSRARRVLMVLALAWIGAATAVLADPKPGTRGLDNEPIDVESRRIAAFQRGEPSRQTFGKLEFRGGLVLTSPSTNFGGWSGLEIDADGRRFVAVSDAGTWLTGELVYDDQRLAGLRHTKLGPLLGLGGKRLVNERDRDAEAIRLVEGTLSKGVLLVTFEQNHRIARHDIGERGLLQPTGLVRRPPEWARMIRNKGLEAVAVIRGGPQRGAVVAFAERLVDSAGHLTGWIWAGGLGGEPQRLSLRRIADFEITDAAGLPDGSLLVLERSFAWLAGVKTQLRLIKAADVRPGAVLDGEVLLHADMGYEIDNMEGLAVHRGSRGEAILTMISDNNFNGFLQRNLILQFALPVPRSTAATAPAPAPAPALAAPPQARRGSSSAAAASR